MATKPFEISSDRRPVNARVGTEDLPGHHGDDDGDEVPGHHDRRAGPSRRLGRKPGHQWKAIARLALTAVAAMLGQMSGSFRFTDVAHRPVPATDSFAVVAEAIATPPPHEEAPATTDEDHDALISFNNVVPYLFNSSTTMPTDVSARPVLTVSERSPATGSDPGHKPGVKDDSFRLENLRLGDKICCGYYKCFYLLKHRPDVAYVVIQKTEKKAQTKKLKSLSGAWRLGQELETNYSQLQLTLAPPEVIQIGEEFAEKLNLNKYNCNNGVKVRRQRYRDGYVVVQKVRPAPTPSLVFGCAPIRRKFFYQEWGNKLLTHVHDKEAFRQNFMDNIATITNLMTSEADPVRCLALDFQFFVDTHGRLYHLDLDRCFKKTVQEKNLNYTLECLDELKLRIHQEIPNKEAIRSQISV